MTETSNEPLPSEAPVPSISIEHAMRGASISPVLFAFLVLGGVFFSYQIVGSVITYVFFGADINPENVQGLRIATITAQFALLLAPALFAVRLVGWNIPNTIRFRGTTFTQAAFVVLSIVALQFVFQGYMLGQEYVLKSYLIPQSLKPVFQQIQDLIDSLYKKLLLMRSGSEMIFVLLVIAITPAICEEILFRGVVQGAFEQRLRLRWTFLLTGSIFAMFHLNPMSFIPLVFLGIYLSFLVWRGNSIFLGVIAHVTNNSIAVFSLYYFKNESGVPKELGPEASPLTLCFISLAGLAVFFGAVMMFWGLTRTTTFSDT